MHLRPHFAGVLLLTAGGIVAGACGCGARSSGLIGGIHVLDDGIVVEDRYYPYSAVVSHATGGGGRVTPAVGWLVPMIESGPWIVTYDSTRTLRNVRKSRLNEDTRLPQWLDDRTLQAINVHSGTVTEIPNTLDSNDDGIVRLRVKGASLIAEVTARYHVGVSEVAARYFIYTLPDGPWQPVSTGDGRAMLGARRIRYAFEDLRRDAGPASGSGVRPPPRARWAQARSFDDLSADGLAEGDWGKLAQRQVARRWETVYTSPAGADTVILRENDLGAAQRQGTVFNRRPLP